MDLPDKCTIWNAGGNDGFGGVSWLGPFVVDCRIAYRAQQFTDTNGDQVTSTAVVYSDSTELKIDSQVYFGESGAITPPADANDVRQLARTPSGTDLVKAWFS